MKSGKTRSKHKSNWGFIIILEENFKFSYILDDTGNLRYRLRQKPHSNLMKMEQYLENPPKKNESKEKERNKEETASVLMQQYEQKKDDYQQDDDNSFSDSDTKLIYMYT